MTFTTRAMFDHQFDDLRQNLVHMGNQVGAAIEFSINALVKRDTALAQKIIADDAAINNSRYQIQEACLALIATQQPAASDLREIVAVLYLVVEMERMGDYAAGIAKTVILMSEEPLLKTLKKIPRMGEIGGSMLADSLQAFIQKDPKWAQEIAARDTEIDDLYTEVFHRLIKIMAKEPEMVARCTYLMWCAHNLERIADRVTNIAEQIIFMTTGTLGELHQ